MPAAAGVASRPSAWRWLAATRPAFLSLTLLGWLIGVAASHPPAALRGGLLLALLGAVLLPATPLIGALLATLALFLPGFLLLWALGPCWQHWLARPRLAGAVAGINAAVVGLLLAALYQPVWQSAVLSPTDLALAAVGFYLLRVPRLPVLPLAAMLTAAALLLA